MSYEGLLVKLISEIPSFGKKAGASLRAKKTKKTQESAELDNKITALESSYKSMGDEMDTIYKEKRETESALESAREKIDTFWDESSQEIIDGVRSTFTFLFPLNLNINVIRPDTRILVYYNNDADVPHSISETFKPTTNSLTYDEFGGQGRFTLDLATPPDGTGDLSNVYMIWGLVDCIYDDDGVKKIDPAICAHFDEMKKDVADKEKRLEELRAARVSNLEKQIKLGDEKVKADFSITTILDGLFP